MIRPIVIKVPSKKASYVAVDSHTKKVLAQGRKMKDVIEKLRKYKSGKVGVIFVPKQGQHYIY